MEKRTDNSPRNDKVRPEIDSWYSRPLDVHVWSEHTEVDDLVAVIFNSFSEEERQAVKGKSNNKGRASGFLHLKIIIIDLFVAWKSDPLLSIGVARANGAFKVNSRYNALHISQRITTIIDILDKRHFIDQVGGSYDRTDSGGSHTSRIRASDKLEALFSALTIEPYELDLNHNQECIILTEDDTDSEGKAIRVGNRGRKKRVQVEYEDDDFPTIRGMRSDLDAYNLLLQQTHIDIPTLTQPYIERELPNNRTQKIPIDQTRKFVRRIFSRNSWEMNGRFYGGFWQQIGKQHRREIYINGSLTIEVDYKGLHAAILSVDHGHNSSEDRYDLGELILPGFDRKQQRAIVKGLILTAINAKSYKSAFSAFRASQPNGTSEKRLQNRDLDLLLKAFINKHPYLEENLCSDKGIELMYDDSQITAKIISQFTQLNKPILSIHDSYIISTMDTELLHQAMTRASKEVVSAVLAVEQEMPSYQQIEAWRHIDRHLYGQHLNWQYKKTNTKVHKEYEERLDKFNEYRRHRFPEYKPDTT